MNDLDPKKFSGSINFDRRLFKYDIKGSIAHVEMLHHISIISAKELALIVKGLNDIEVEIENDSFNPTQVAPELWSIDLTISETW